TAPSGGCSSSGNSPCSWATVSGWLAASSAASTMRVISAWSRRDPVLCPVLGAMRGAGSGAGAVAGLVVDLAGEAGRGVLAGFRRERLHVDRAAQRRGLRLLLDDVQQPFLGQFEQAEEGDHHPEPALARLEQRLEAVEAAVAQPLQQLAHALAHA